MVVGGVHFPVDRLTVGPIHFDPSTGLNADGLFGADLLLAFEVDINAPGHALTLYHVRRCADARPDWPEPAIEVTGVTARKDRMLIPFQLDEHAGLAVLDTGSQRTIIGLPMAKRLGLTEPGMANDPTVRYRGTGPNLQAAHVHRFQALRIGPTIIARPALSVLPTDPGFGDALIGADFLQGRRVWLSFPTHRFFISAVRHDAATD
jgi:hypothetical protein